MKTEAIGPGEEAEDRNHPEHENLQLAGASASRPRHTTTKLQHSTTPSLRATGFEHEDEAPGELSGSRPAMTAGRTGRKRRFWVVPVLSAIPTLLVILLIFLLKDYDFPKEVVGVLFIAVVIPSALICEKLGLGQFNILGGSTIPDWLFYSVMILLVYLYSLVLVTSGRGIVSLMGRVFLKVRSETREVRGD
jgi:hypothetical protein